MENSTDVQNGVSSETEDPKHKAMAEVVINGESANENGEKELSNGKDGVYKENDEMVIEKDVHAEGELVNGSKCEERESVGTEKSIDVAGDIDELVEPNEKKELKESDKMHTKRTAQVIKESQENPTTKSQLSEKLNNTCKEENKSQMTYKTTLDFVRNTYDVGVKMSGRRPLRGIVSTHPASKRKACYSINESPDKKKIKETPSTEDSVWNYFPSPSLRFWNYKDSSINGQQVLADDSMVVNVDDMSIINNRLDDSQLENNWSKGNKPFWKTCNLM